MDLLSYYRPSPGLVADFAVAPEPEPGLELAPGPELVRGHEPGLGLGLVVAFALYSTGSSLACLR